MFTVVFITQDVCSLSAVLVAAGVPASPNASLPGSTADALSVVMYTNVYIEPSRTFM